MKRTTFFSCLLTAVLLSLSMVSYATKYPVTYGFEHSEKENFPSGGTSPNTSNSNFSEVGFSSSVATTWYCYTSQKKSGSQSLACKGSTSVITFPPVTLQAKGYEYTFSFYNYYTTTTINDERSFYIYANSTASMDGAIEIGHFYNGAKSTGWSGENKVQIPSSLYGGDVYIMIKHMNQSSYRTVIDDVTFIEKEVSCPAVDAGTIYVDDIQTSSATIYWSPADEEEAWNVIVTDKGTGAQVLNTVITGDPECKITNLQHSRTYNWNISIQAKCSDSDLASQTTSSQTFETPCTAYTDYPVVIDFEQSEGFPQGAGSDQTSNLISNSCWQNPDKWYIYDTNYKSGKQSVKCPTSVSKALFLPVMHGKENAEYTISFYVYKNSGTYTDRGVKVYVNSSQTKTSATLIGSCLSYNSSSSDSWLYYELKIPKTLTSDADFYLMFERWYSSSTLYIDDIQITEKEVSCSSVDASTINVINTTSSSTTISWQPAASEEAWNLIVKDNVTAEELVNTTVTTPSYTIQNLQHSRGYELNVSVTSKCSATDVASATEKILNFQTECVAYTTYPVTFGFEQSEGFPLGNSSDQTTNRPNSCWTNPNHWYVRTGTSHGGSQSLRCPGSSNAIILPRMYGKSEYEYTVSFYVEKQSGSYEDRTIDVYINSTNSEVNAVNIGSCSRYSTSSESWLYYELKIPTTYTNNADYYILFKQIGSGFLYMDDIQISQTEFSCASIEASTIDVTNLTTNSATITWDAAASETSWNLVVTDNVTAEELVNTTVTTPSYTIQNLQHSRQYKWVVGVTADCGATTSSATEKTLSFQTECAAYTTYPVTFGFEQSEGFPLGNSSDQTTNRITNSCWTNPNHWFITNNQTYQGLQALKSSSSGTYLALPAMSFEIGFEYSLSFGLYMNSGTHPDYGVRVYVNSTNSLSGAEEIGFFCNYANTSGYVNKTVKIPTNHLGVTYIIFKHENASTLYLDNIKIEETEVTCPSVLASAIELENITASSATILWQAAAAETAWNIVITDNITGDEFVNASVTTPSYQITNLEHSHCYNWLVSIQAKCSVSDIASVTEKSFAFQTECLTYTTYPITFGFEQSEGFPQGTTSDITTNRLTNTCWNNPNNWYLYSSFAKTGSQSIRSNGTNTMLAMPAISCKEGCEYTMQFHLYQNTSHNEYGTEVYVNTTNSLNTGNPIDLGFYSISPINATPDYELTLPENIAGTVYIIFKHINGGTLAIDDISITEKERPCQEISNVSVDNITTSGATVFITSTAAVREVLVTNVSVTPDAVTADQIVLRDGNVTSDNKSISGLTPATTYYVYARNICSTTNKSDWTEEKSFTTACGEISDVAVSNITSTSAQVTFTTAGTQAEILVTNASVNPDQPGAAVVYNNNSVTSSPVSLTSLTANTTYYVYMRNICSETSKSAWSTEVSFTTACGEISDVAVSNITSTSAQVTFTTAGTQAEILVTNASVNPDQPGDAVVYKNGNVTSSPVSLTSLTANTTYYVYMRNICSETSKSAWTTEVSFTTACGELSDVAVNNITSTSAQVTFTTAGTQAEILVTNASVDPDQPGVAEVYNNDNVTSSPVSLTSLTANTTYYVYMRNICSATSKSAWTTEVSFTTACGELSDVAVSNITSTSAQVTFTTAGIQAEILVTNASVDPDQPGVAEVYNNDNVTSSPVSLTSLTANTTYYVYMRNICSETSKSAWTTAVNFTTQIGDVVLYDTQAVPSELLDQTCNVTLNRILRAGMYNTLCLPFSLTSMQIENSGLNGMEILTLTGTETVGTTISINIDVVSNIVAGKPYIVNVPDGEDIENLQFPNVTITTVDGSYQQDANGQIDFYGILAPTMMYANDKTKIMVGEYNSLFWSDLSNNMNGFRAYFQTRSDNPVQAPCRFNYNRGVVTNLNDVNAQTTIKKILKDNQILIIRDGGIFTIQGQQIKK